MSARLLVLGRNGQLARALARAAEARGIDAVCAGREQIDLAEPGRVRAAIEAFEGVEIIINAAAFTAVDACERDRAACFAVNAHGAGEAARAAHALGAGFIQVSTDYVFPGTGSRPIPETGEPDPVNVYGASKRAGELAVLDAHPQAAVVRTSAVFSAEGRNFAKTMIERALTGQETAVVADQIVAPTPADDLADSLLRLAATGGSGIFHAAGHPETSWYGFASAIFKAVEARGHNTGVLSQTTSAEYGAPAKRPAYSVLEDTRLETLIGPAPIDWRAGLTRVVDALVPAR